MLPVLATVLPVLATVLATVLAAVLPVLATVLPVLATTCGLSACTRHRGANRSSRINRGRSNRGRSNRNNSRRGIRNSSRSRSSSPGNIRGTEQPSNERQGIQESRPPLLPTVPAVDRHGVAHVSKGGDFSVKYSERASHEPYHSKPPRADLSGLPRYRSAYLPVNSQTLCRVS